MQRKAVTMSMTVVVSAVILILIAIVLIFIFNEGISPVAIFARDCETKGGTCSYQPCRDLGYELMPYDKSCQDKNAGEYCCYSGRTTQP
ncbi:MAG: hypothetical protein HC945_00540 [Nitrosarchaeum sp.]|nr:hypothetical protein [Nitrosarchaeum sp.]